MKVTKVKIGLAITAIGIAVIAGFLVQHRSRTALRQENQRLRQQVEQLQSSAESARLPNQVARVKQPTSTGTNEQSKELMKLCGEVGALRQHATEAATSKTNGPSMLSGLPANSAL